MWTGLARFWWVLDKTSLTWLLGVQSFFSVLYFNTFMTNCDFLELENCLLHWQTCVIQFKWDQKIICLLPNVTLVLHYAELWIELKVNIGYKLSWTLLRSSERDHKIQREAISKQRTADAALPPVIINWCCFKMTALKHFVKMPVVLTPLCLCLFLASPLFASLQPEMQVEEVQTEKREEGRECRPPSDTHSLFRSVVGLPTPDGMAL